MSRLYTKTGDNGLTNLYDMRRIGKDNTIFEVLGDLDELSAHIGVVCSLTGPDFPDTEKMLRWIQARLLDIGSDIATSEKREKITPITEDDVKKIEIYIDLFTAETPKLTEFILPGHKLLDAQVHVCRAVCRRAERHMWVLRKESQIATDLQTFVFINRLSDFFFALSRVYAQGHEITRSFANNLE